MIQRIQTVYLALVLIFSFVGVVSTMGEWTFEGETVASFSNFTFSTFGAYSSYESWGPFCLGIFLILVMFLTLVSIMLFRKRMRQLRLTIISTILLIGYVLCFALFFFKYDATLAEVVVGQIPEFHFSFLSVLPVFSIILNILAIIAIRKDEALVRSLDRLR
ncbi:MAG: DUF4293 domain-containing protein [Bacteroidaceae bacterium]|nr:DUF4293 domain-containing protein [Bacteroidaceae bacterium]